MSARYPFESSNKYLKYLLSSNHKKSDHQGGEEIEPEEEIEEEDE